MTEIAKDVLPKEVKQQLPPVTTTNGDKVSSDSKTAAPAVEADAITDEEKVVQKQNETAILVNGQWAINDSLAIVSHYLQHVLLTSSDFRKSVVQYIATTQHASTPPSLFVTVFHPSHATGWDMVRLISMSDDESKNLFDKHTVQTVTECRGSDSVVIIVNFIPPEAQYCMIRYFVVATLGRDKDNGSATRFANESYEACVKRQVDNSKLLVMSGKFDISPVASGSGISTDKLKSMLKSGFSKRLDCAENNARAQVMLDVREACVRYNAHKAIVDQDAKATGELPPWQCVRIVCGGYAPVSVSLLNQANIEELRNKLLASNDGNENDQLVCSYKALLDIMKNKRCKNEAAVIVIRSFYGACASMVMCHTICIDMEGISQGADEEQKRRASYFDEEYNQRQAANSKKSTKK